MTARLFSAMFTCVCLASSSLAADAIQALTARPELPEGRRSPLCILLPGGAGRMSEATGAMDGLGNQLAERGWIVVVPVSPDGRSFFGDAAEHVLTVMDRFERDPGVRPGRALLVGVSNGGIAALQVASMVPNRVSGVIAVPGMLNERVSLRRVKHLPIYVRIGAEDQLGWADHYDDIVRKLKRAGVRLDAELVEGAGHGVPVDWEEIDAWIADEIGALGPAPKRKREISLPAGAARMRVWTSRSGASARAALAEIHEDHIILMRQGGQKAKILRENLSRADLDYLASLVEAADRVSGSP